MTVNNEEPHIQTYIAVKVGTRNDPEETTRTIKSQVIDSYLTNVIYKGVKEERNKAIYEKVKTMSLDDVKAHQRQLVNDRTYTYAVQGDKSNIDMDYLRTLGPVTEVTQKQIFGY